MQASCGPLGGSIIKPDCKVVVYELVEFGISGVAMARYQQEGEGQSDPAQPCQAVSVKIICGSQRPVERFDRVGNERA